MITGDDSDVEHLADTRGAKHEGLDGKEAGVDKHQHVDGRRPGGEPCHTSEGEDAEEVQEVGGVERGRIEFVELVGKGGLAPMKQEKVGRTDADRRLHGEEVQGREDIEWIRCRKTGDPCPSLLNELLERKLRDPFDGQEKADLQRKADDLHPE
jgi:hypothetical protein